MDYVGRTGCYFCWELVRCSFDMARSSQTSLRAPPLFICRVSSFSIVERGKKAGGGGSHAARALVPLHLFVCSVPSVGRPIRNLAEKCELGVVN